MIRYAKGQLLDTYCQAVGVTRRERKVLGITVKESDRSLRRRGQIELDRLCASKNKYK